MINAAHAINILRGLALAAGLDEVIGVQRMRKAFHLGKPKARGGKAALFCEANGRRPALVAPAAPDHSPGHAVAGLRLALKARFISAWGIAQDSDRMVNKR